MDELDRWIDQEVEIVTREMYKWVDREPLYEPTPVGCGKLFKDRQAEAMWHSKERNRRNRGNEKTNR